MTTNSADISVFNFHPEWNISGVVPVLNIYNLSEGDNLAGVVYWFECFSGGNIPFHIGEEDTPDKTGVWTTYNVTEPIPQVLGHIEWSGAFFRVKGYVKDVLGNIFSLEKSVKICRPTGNTGQANNFGVADMEVITKCDRARIYVEDKTNYDYNGNSGLMISKKITLNYPPDPTDTIPAPKVVTNVSNALLPITRNGDGYLLTLSSVYEYTFSDGSTILIQYKFKHPLNIQCNVDLCPLISDIQRLEDDYERNGCNTDQRTNLALINSKMNRALMAKIQPMCGVDVAKIVEEIKELGDFTCECVGNEFNGINAVVDDGNGTVDCSAMEACLNSILNQVNPSCLNITDITWSELSVLAKFQKILDSYCCANITDIQQAV